MTFETIPARIRSFIRQRIAARKLQRIVEARRNSAEIEQYRRKREAALLGILRREVSL
jgi:hypothetical protein